jgi:hypothetical protein
MSLDSPRRTRIYPEGFRWRVVQALVAGLVMSGGAVAALRLPDAPASATPPVASDRSEGRSDDRGRSKENNNKDNDKDNRGGANADLPRFAPSVSGNLVTFTQVHSGGSQSIIAYDLGTGRERVISSPATPQATSIAGSPWTIVQSSEPFSPINSYVAANGAQTVPIGSGRLAAVSGDVAVTSTYAFSNSAAFTLTSLTNGSQMDASFPDTGYYSEASALAVSGTSVVAARNYPLGLSFFTGANHTGTVSVNEPNCSIDTVRFEGSAVRFAGRCYSAPYLMVGVCNLPCTTSPMTTRVETGDYFSYAPYQPTTALAGSAVAFFNADRTMLSVYDPSRGPTPHVMYQTSGALIGLGLQSPTVAIFSENVFENGQYRQVVLRLDLSTGALTRLTSKGSVAVPRPQRSVASAADVRQGTVSYVVEANGVAKLTLQPLNGSATVLSDVVTGVMQTRLDTQWVLWGDAAGGVVGRSLIDNRQVVVAEPSNFAYGIPARFDVRGNEAIVSTITANGALPYSTIVRNLATGQVVRNALEATGTGETSEGVSVEASDAGFLFDRYSYTPFGLQSGIVLRTVTGQEEFIPNDNPYIGRSVVSDGWIASNWYDYNTGNGTTICRFPCSTETRISYDNTSSQSGIAVAGTKVALTLTSYIMQGQSYGASPTRVVAFDRNNPSAAPVVLMEANGTFSELRADGNDMVFSLRRFVAGVEVSTVYAYDATTGRLRALTP